MSTVPNPAAHAGAFSKTAALAIVLVGVFAFSAFMVLSAYAPALRQGTDGGSHALSKSATGYAFLAELLKRSGLTVLAPRGAIPDAQNGLVVFTPRDYDAFETIDTLDPYQITLIIAPKWNTAAHQFRPGWVHKRDTKEPSSLTLNIGTETYAIAFKQMESETNISVQASDTYGGVVVQQLPSQNIGAIDRLQFLEESDLLEPMIATHDGAVLVAKIKGEPYYILSDPDLANTHGLTDPTRARLATALFDYARTGGPVIFDLSLHGIERTRNIIKLALEPPFLAATLCALFAGLLLAVKAAARFGPVQRRKLPFEAGKAALADNSAALIRMANREAAFGGRYADLIRRRLGAALGAPKGADIPAMDKIIKKAAGRMTRDDFATLTARAKQSEDKAQFVTNAQRLYEFKKEITGEPR